jgi:hypothetical protein
VAALPFRDTGVVARDEHKARTVGPAICPGLHRKENNMNLTTNLRKAICIIGLAGTFLISGCAGSPTVKGSATPPSTKATTAASGTAFNSAKFGVPLSLEVDPLLTPAPTQDSKGLLWWPAKANDNDRIRFLLPAEYYPAGRSPAKAPPSDYASYLKSLTDKGVRYTDRTSVMVDGTTVSVMSGTTTNGLDGSLGCPTIGADQAEGCFGIQPDYMLRIAVLKHGTSSILAWARTDSKSPNTEFLHRFDAMLHTVKFR